MRSIQVCAIYLVGMLFAAFDPAFAMQESRATLEGRIAGLNPISDAAQAAYTSILNQVLADPIHYPFGPQLAQLVPAASFKVYGAQRFAGVDGQPRTVTARDFSQWQPRVGFAYQIFPRTVLSGRFGRFVSSQRDQRRLKRFQLDDSIDFECRQRPDAL